MTGDDGRQQRLHGRETVSIKTVHRTAQPKKKIFTMAEVLHRYVFCKLIKKREDNLLTTYLVSVLKSATKNPKFVATLYIFSAQENQTL